MVTPLADQRWQDQAATLIQKTVRGGAYRLKRHREDVALEQVLDSGFVAGLGHFSPNAKHTRQLAPANNVTTSLTLTKPNQPQPYTHPLPFTNHHHHHLQARQASALAIQKSARGFLGRKKAKKRLRRFLIREKKCVRISCSDTLTLMTHPLVHH